MTETNSIIDENTKSALNKALSMSLPSNALDYKEYINKERKIQILVDSSYDKDILIKKYESEIEEYISQNNELDIKSTVNDIISLISDNPKVILNGVELYSIPYILKTEIQNGKVIEREFGTKKDGKRHYSIEEVKVILKEAEEKRCGKKFKDGRGDKFTFLSLITDMDSELVGNASKNPIRFIKPDCNSKNDIYDEITKIVEQAKNDPNSPSILLIPYSANGHIVTLLVDKNKFSKINSVACFDSSHYFTSAFNDNDKPKISSRVRIGMKYIADHHIITSLLLTGGTIGVGVARGIVGVASGIVVGTAGIVGARFGDGVLSSRLTGDFNKECFPDKLYGCMIKKPINDKIIQGLGGTCSFYTEAFCYLINEYIQRSNSQNLDLDEIGSYINNGSFINKLKETKTKFFNQYGATMKEVEQKQQKEKKLEKLQHANQPSQEQAHLNNNNTQNIFISESLYASSGSTVKSLQEGSAIGSLASVFASETTQNEQHNLASSISQGTKTISPSRSSTTSPPNIN